MREGERFSIKRENLDTTYATTPEGTIAPVEATEPELADGADVEQEPAAAPAAASQPDERPVNTRTPDATPLQQAAPVQQMEYVHVLPRDNTGAPADLYVVDENADPAQSIVERGSGRRLRPTTREEKLRVREGVGGGARAYQREPTQTQQPQTGPAITDEAQRQALVDNLAARPININAQRNAQRQQNQTVPRIRQGQQNQQQGQQPGAQQNAGQGAGQGQAQPQQQAPRRAARSLEAHVRDMADDRNLEGTRTGGRGRGGGGGVEPPNARGAMGIEPPGRRGGAGRISAGGETLEPHDWGTRRREFRGLAPKSISELLADPRDDLAYSRLIESLDPRGMEIKRKHLAGEPLTAEERRIMNYTRYEHARRMKQIDSIFRTVKTADLELAARRDEDFAATMAFRGPQRTLDVFKAQMLDLAMKDKDMLDRLEAATDRISSLRTTRRYKHWDEKVRGLASQAGVGMQNYDATFAGLDQRGFFMPGVTARPGYAERQASQQDIAERLRREHGRFRAIVDKTLGISEHKARTMMRKAVRLDMKTQKSLFSPTSWAVGQIDEDLGVLTGFLRHTITDNPEVIHMVEQEAIRNQNLSTDAERGPATFAAAQEQRALETRQANEAIDRHVSAFRTADGRDWDHSSVDERIDSLAPLRDTQARAQERKGENWFSRAIMSIVRAAFGVKEREVINRPVLA